MIKNTDSNLDRFGTQNAGAFLNCFVGSIHQPIGNTCPLFLVNAMAENIRYEFSIHVLRLAEIIREVDGNHSLGAAALAEAILAHPRINHVLPQGHAEANDVEDAHLFRLWIRVAAKCPSVLVGLLFDCFSPQDYREALRKFDALSKIKESSPTPEETIQ